MLKFLQDILSEISPMLLITLSSTLISFIQTILVKNRKKKMQDSSPRNNKISLLKNLHMAQVSLESSRKIIEQAYDEIQNQNDELEKLKTEIEKNQQIATISAEQAEAVKQAIAATINKQEQKQFPKTLIWNTIFCILSAVLGFLLGKFF